MRLGYLYLLAVVLPAQTLVEPAPSAAGAEFFENKIRPVISRNCYQCHSPSANALSGGLSLDTREGLRRGGASGPAVVPGKPDESVLIRALRYDGRMMPPFGKLPDEVVADFEKWVAMGAPDPRGTKFAEVKQSSIDINEGRKFWAFQPVKDTPPPQAPKTKRKAPLYSSIDRYLLPHIQKAGIDFNPEADRVTLIRRITFDITGLPPTPDETQSFLTDKRPGAYERLVDRLIASPRFGERWGRHWLDVARYAESIGRGRNYAFPLAWRYRDYVIQSFNEDKPYDTFIREQIAGDLIPAATPEDRNRGIVATGFLSLGALEINEPNPAVRHMDALDEQVNAVSRAFLGLTVGCARCHDHKFDPIPTSDYYSMAGIFHSTELLSGIRLDRPTDNSSFFDARRLAELNWDEEKQGPAFLKDPDKLKRYNELIATVDDIRKGKPVIGKDGKPLPKVGASFAYLKELDSFPLPKNLAMGVREGHVEDSNILVGGEVTRIGPPAPRGVIQVVSKPGAAPSIAAGESGRLQLAEWLSSRDNPLTARVAVNRIWYQMFGRGIVGTVDNFGAMGERPTNPQLLDYLALRFQNQGWSVKKVVREIALSRAYRQSSNDDESKTLADPENKLFARMNRRRLEVECIRDAILAVSGQIDLSKPEASPVLDFKRATDVGRAVIGTNPPDYSVTDRHRAVYVPVIRNKIWPMYQTFDFPEPSEGKGSRDVTTVPTQALFMVNSKFVLDQARFAAEKLLRDETPTRQRVIRVYRETVGREPATAEIEQSMKFLDVALSNEKGANDPAFAWQLFYQAMFSTAEFRYRL